jgi:hypothetical protein
VFGRFKAAVNALLVVSSCALTISAAEATLRLMAWPEWDTEVKAGWRARENPEHRTNEFGFRGQSIRYEDGDIVIVMLGDSQVESLACSADNMPEHYLQESLQEADARYKVFTLGAGGYGTDQEYLALEEYFQKYRADAVILWQTMGNDIWNNVFPTNMPKDGPIKPTFWLEDGILKGPNFQLDQIVRSPAQTKLGVLINRPFFPQDLDAKWERYLPPAAKPLPSYDGTFDREWDPGDPQNRNPYIKNENLVNEKSHFTIALYPRSERTQYGIDLMNGLLKKTRKLTESKGGTFFVLDVIIDPVEAMPFRNGEQFDDIVVHKYFDVFYRSSGKQAIANKQDIDEGVSVLTIPLTAKDWRVSDTDSHLNCLSDKQVMHDLSRKILEQVVPRRASTGRSKQ